METNRRTFMTALAAGAAVTRIVRGRGPLYPIAFSTLGCPAWSWKNILDYADRLGYSAIELRGVAGEMDLTKVPELSGTQLAATKKDLAALGLVVSDLGASAVMHETGVAREKALDEGRRFIELAHAMGVKYVRMFGDKIAPDEPRASVFARVIDGFHQMAAHAQPAGVTVLIESHGDFTHSNDIATILNGVGSDAFALLWDAHHTYAEGHEQPAVTFAALQKWVRHTHLKDSTPAGTERKVRADRKRRCAGKSSGQDSRVGWVQRVLLLRVGKEMAPRDRGAGDRLPTLRQDDDRVFERSWSQAELM